MFKRVFIKMNTAVSSSAAVERVFSIEDILNHKRMGLSDIHLEILLFFKASKWNHVGYVIISFLVCKQKLQNFVTFHGVI